MQITEFLEMDSKAANEKLKSAYKDGKISVKELGEYSGQWLEHRGLIKTDMGWHTMDEYKEMGYTPDHNGDWHMETEHRSVTRYNRETKEQENLSIRVPSKMIAWDEKQLALRQAQENADKNKARLEEMEKILTTDFPEV